MKYYISDLHLFHEKAIKYDHRPFDSIQDMHEVIMKNWNDRVTNGDIVYILGDITMEKSRDYYKLALLKIKSYFLIL